MMEGDKWWDAGARGSSGGLGKPFLCWSVVAGGVCGDGLKRGMLDIIKKTLGFINEADRELNVRG